MKEHGSSTVTLKANKAGTATITATATDASDATGSTAITGTKSVKITVKDPVQNNNVSGDASLKSITVAGKTYNNPKTDMTVTVDASLGSANITAVATDANSKITGTGTKELVTGTNSVTITVTAPGGAKKTYNVRIRKLADTTTTPNVRDTPNTNPDEQTPQEPAILDLRLVYLRIEDVELTPEFDPEVFEYIINVTNKDRLEIVAVQNIEDAELEITGNEELKDGKNEIIIKITKEGQQEVEYRITVNKTTEGVVTDEDETDKKEQMAGFFGTPGGKIAIGIGGTGAAIVLGFGIWKAKTASEVGSRSARRASVRRSSFNDFND